MYEVASALAFIHGVGVIHADLKPEVCLVLLGELDFFLGCFFWWPVSPCSFCR